MDPIINPRQRSLYQPGTNPPCDNSSPGTGETHTTSHQAFDKALNEAELRLRKTNLGSGQEARGDGGGEQDLSKGDKGSDGEIDAEERDGEPPDRGDENSEGVMEGYDDTSGGSSDQKDAISDEEMKDDDGDNRATADAKKPPSPIAVGRRTWRFDVLSPPILRQ